MPTRKAGVMRDMRIQAQEMVAPVTTNAEQVARRVIGIPAGVEISGLVDPAELVRAQIIESAAMTMDLYSEECEIQGVHYRRSIGTEHFPTAPGVFDKAVQKNGEPFGFQIVQKVDKRNQDAQPMYLVVNGDMSVRAATMQILSKAITPGTGSILIEDPAALDTLSVIVASIGVDSRERAEVRAGDIEAKKQSRRHTFRRRLGNIVMTGILGTGAYFGAHKVVEWNASYNDTVAAEQAAQDKAAAEAQAKADAEAADQKAREAAAADKALKRREEAIRKFDAQTKMNGEIYLASAGQVTAIQPTDQFIDATVPMYGASDVSQNLANDLTAPRAIEAPAAGENGSCSTVDLPVSVGDSFKIASDGTSTDAMIARFDPKTDTLTLCNQGLFGGTGPSTVSTVYIQRG